jgi:hypothetical protein
MKSRPGAVFALLILFSASLGCGNNPTLQSVNVTPGAATASQAQFSATGIYSNSSTPMDVTATITWCIGSSTGLCTADVASFAEVTAGLAECSPDFSGTVTVLAGQIANHPGLNQAAQLQPFGAAQLTCP